jgi:ABC-type nitrate/sulfonate/bicarbonate transport system substrate-binding protein
MVSKDVLSFCTKPLAFLALTAFIVTHNFAIAAAETLKLGFSGSSATQLAGYLAVDQKLFDIYGVNVELTQSAGTTMIRALDSGSLHVAIVGGGQALNAYVKGVEVRIISGLVNTVPFQLWVKPELSQLNDLKGKLIANTPPGTSLNLANQILLARAGLHPLKDVKLVAFGRLGLVSQSLLSGVVDAGLLSPPETTEARRAGLRMLIDMSTPRIPCLFTSVVVSKAALEKSPASLDRFLRGILHGIKLVLTNPDMAKKTLSRQIRLTDPEALEEAYRQVVAVYERLPIVPKDAIETVVKFSTERSGRDPFGVADTSILERIDKEGFVRALYPAK